jgi:two-component system OmpR family sensor kinase
MSSSRARLTAWFSVVMIATLAVFGAAMYWARNIKAGEELARRADVQGSLALRIIAQAGVADISTRVLTDSLAGPELSPRLRALLEAVPEYVVVRDEQGYVLFQSLRVRQMAPSTQNLIVETADTLNPGTALRTYSTRGAFDILVVRRQGYTADGRIWDVITAVDAQEVSASRREVLGAMLVVAPFLLVFAIGGSWLIAGRAFRPLDRVTHEMEAITDGRSLHRRLQLETSGDELSRHVTTLNAMIGRLESSFGGLRRFTADASHELKTPLTVLRANLERSMRADPGSHEQMAALEEALQETARMSDLVDSLLTLARADEGRFDLHREPVELGPLCRDVFETAVILGEHQGLEVGMPHADEALVLGDRTRLRQLFLNLITNAIKYTPKGGKVELSLVRAADTVSFAVKDNGIGIAAADLPYIFERFWRADRARSRSAERGGFGLGLAISHWIAQAHGGTLTVQSRLNRGSTFTATFPVAHPALEDRGEGAATPADDSAAVTVEAHERA